MSDLGTRQPFCPKCSSTDLRTYRGPPWTRCEVCGWEGHLWQGHLGTLDALEALEAENAQLRKVLADACRDLEDEARAKHVGDHPVTKGLLSRDLAEIREYRAALRDTEEPGT